MEDLNKENNRNESVNTYREFSFRKMELSKEFHKNFIKVEGSFIIEFYYIKLIKNCLCTFGYTSYSFDKFLDLPLHNMIII